ncbi:MAG: hypothetical protein DRJ05_19965 [Bacteroidetes bacterium]|nr:MAG: hypothetical protein DRJ05_19965 [Bacteroidota bacterium]
MKQKTTRLCKKEKLLILNPVSKDSNFVIELEKFVPAKIVKSELNLRESYRNRKTKKMHIKKPLMIIYTNGFNTY